MSEDADMDIYKASARRAKTLVDSHPYVPPYVVSAYSVIAERVEELEEKAKGIWMENTDWDFVLDMLGEDERKEYDELYHILFMTKPDAVVGLVKEWAGEEE